MEYKRMLYTFQVSLITKEELDTLPPDTILYSIFNELVIVGRSNIDLDTRMGFLAYGFKVEKLND